jgi:hypothetical protein
MFSKFRMRITTTAAGIACMVVAVVSAGFTVYAGFRLVVPRVYASGLTALVFLLLAVGLLLLLKEEETREDDSSRLAPTGVGRWAGLAGEILAAVAVGVLASANRRRPER